MADGIDGLRDRMDGITLEMVRLLSERIGVAREIGEVKKTMGRGVSDEERESRLYAKVVGLSREIGLDTGMAARFLNLLLNESVRIQSGGKQSHLSVFHRAKELEREGRRIIHMEVGEPDFMPPDAVGAAMAEAFEKGLTRYGSAWGTAELRGAIAQKAAERWCGASPRRPGPGNVLVTPGARFSVFLAVTTLLDPGDEMIIIEPAWPAYRDCAMNAGVKVRAVRTTLEDGWEPRIDEVARLVSPNTRMIVLNYPNNPTGKVLPAAVQDGIVEIAKRNGLYLLSDEIYAAYAGGGGSGNTWKSVLEYGYDRAVVVQSFSKSHAMTGFRIGYTIADESVVGRMAGLQALCLTSVAEPVQHAALAALEEDVSGSAAVIRERLDVLAEAASGMGLEFANPDGAMYIFARAAGGGGGGFGGTRLAGRALEEEGLAIAPGEGFGDYGGFIRISACNDVKILKEGMDRLGRLITSMEGPGDGSR